MHNITDKLFNYFKSYNLTVNDNESKLQSDYENLKNRLIEAKKLKYKILDSITKELDIGKWCCVDDGYIVYYDRNGKIKIDIERIQYKEDSFYALRVWLYICDNPLILYFKTEQDFSYLKERIKPLVFDNFKPRGEL